MIIISYPVDGQFGYSAEKDEAITTYMHGHDLTSCGSGSGFGQRDLEFDSDTNGDGAAFKEGLGVHLNALCDLVGRNVTIYCSGD